MNVTNATDIPTPGTPAYWTAQREAVALVDAYAFSDPDPFVELESHPFQGVHYLIRPFIDDESISKAVVSADLYFFIASGSSSPVHGPGTMVPKQARKQPPRAAGAY